MQNHTLKFYLRKDKENTYGKQPIYMRLTVDRKHSVFSTSYYIYPKQWDDRRQVVVNHPDEEEMNLDLANRRKEVLQTLVHAKVKGKAITAAGIRSNVKGSDLFLFSEAYEKELQHKRSEGLKDVWKKNLKKLEAYVGNRRLNFEQIDAAFLNDFEHWLRTEGINARKADSSNYIHQIMKTVRTFCNAAKDKGVIDVNPFKGYEMPKTSAGDKDYLSMEELQAWHTHLEDLPDDYRSVAAWFLLGCYTGLRNSDWYTFDFKKKVKRDHLVLRAKKNGEWVVVPLYEKLRQALALCKKYPLLNAEPVANRYLKEIPAELNKHLKPSQYIDKYLTTHCARRTFAVTMCLGQGISSETAAELMGITVKVFVDNYAAVTPHMIKRETERAWGEL